MDYFTRVHRNGRQLERNNDPTYLPGALNRRTNVVHEILLRHLLADVSIASQVILDRISRR